MPKNLSNQSDNLQSESNKLEIRQPNLLIRVDTLNTAPDWMDGGLLFVSASHKCYHPCLSFSGAKNNKEIRYNFRCTFGYLGDHKRFCRPCINTILWLNRFFFAGKIPLLTLHNNYKYFTVNSTAPTDQLDWSPMELILDDELHLNSPQDGCFYIDYWSGRL